MNKSTISISKLIKISTPIILLITILINPILHQTLPSYTSHFSILQCIQSDISEHQLDTPYFISTIFKSNNGTINKTITTQPSKSLISATQTKEPITYQSYGIVSGDGTTSTIILKVGTEWESYKISSKYIGNEAKLITTDKEINPTNFKTIKILTVTDFNKKDNIAINNVNEMTNEYNAFNDTTK